LEGAVFYLNPHPVSFVFAPNTITTIPTAVERISYMGRQGFDPYHDACVSEAIEPFSDPRDASLKAVLKEGSVDEETFQIGLQRPGWVVFSEVMYPGWKAWLDGKEVRLFTADNALRALWVPEGEHEVLFRYRPGWLLYLSLGLLLWFLSVAVFRPWRRTR
jgi:hypothetical protein